MTRYIVTYTHTYPNGDVETYRTHFRVKRAAEVEAALINTRAAEGKVGLGGQTVTATIREEET